MTGVRWITPLGPGPLTDDAPALVVEVDEQLRIDVYQRGRANGRLPLLDPTTACRLGQALQDAAAYAGRKRAARSSR